MAGFFFDLAARFDPNQTIFIFQKNITPCKDYLR